MLEKNPLDELEALLQERERKRMTFLATFLDSLDPMREGSRRWFTYETKAVEKEIELLNVIMPEETPAWKGELGQIKKKFERALQYVAEVAKRAKRGEVKSVDEIYKRPSAKKGIIVLPPPLRRSKEKEAPLDITESLLEIWDAASELENLVKKVEREAIRTLRLRRLVRLEIKERARP